MTRFLKNMILPMLLLTVAYAGAQEKVKLVNSEVSFFSEAPLENIEAHNKKAVAVIDVTTKKYLFRVPIKSFVFEKSLMQEHFNENYMESEKYPNAAFSGSIEGDFDMKKDGTYEVVATGGLEVHGKKQTRSIPATITVKGKEVTLESKFEVHLEDHDIEIPTLVFNKIAEVVEVKIKGELVGM